MPSLKSLTVVPLILLCQFPALAQLAPQTTEEKLKGVTVIMSPFVVQQGSDVGYRATNTTSGTSLNTLIKDLPMTIQVVTEEFMSDIGATDFTEALAYSSGVFSDSNAAAGGGNSASANEGGGSAERSASASAGRSRFANLVSIRGFDVPFQTRLGFRVGGIVITPTTNIALGGLLDSVNLDRMEVVKGPNSLLYGVGVLSGIVNAIPKKPTSERRYTVNLSAGNYGFYRETVDITSRVFRTENHTLNARVAGAAEQRGHYTDWQTKRQHYATAQLDYFFKDKVNAFFEFQNSKTKYNGTGAQWIYDNGGGSDPFFRNQWDERYNFARESGPLKGVGTVDRRIIETDAAGRPLRTPIVQLYYTQPVPGQRQLQGGGLPDTTRLTGPDTYEKRDEDNLLLNFDFTPTKNLALSAGAYYTKQETEEFDLHVENINNSSGGINLRNVLTAIGQTEFTVKDVVATANPFFIARDRLPATDVNPFDNVKITSYWWSKRPTSSESFQWRMRGTYTRDVKLPLIGESNHTFLAGMHFINDKVRFLNGNETSNRAYNRDTALTDALYFRPAFDYSVFRYKGETLAMPGLRYSQQDIWFKGFYGVYQGKYWNDKLGTIIGLRYDEYNAKTADFIRLDPDRTKGLTKEQIQALEISYVNNPNNTTYGKFAATDNFPKPITSWSKTFALNYKINNRFTAYGLYAEGIAPNTGLTDGNNKFIDAENTTSKELGIKFALRDNRITGSISAYEIRRKNAIWDFAYAPAPARWKGAPNPPVGQPNTSNRFDPKPASGKYVLTYGINAKETPPEFNNAYVAGNSNIIDPVTLHRTYFITTRDPAGNAIRQQIPGMVDFANPGGTADSPQIFYVKYADLDVPFKFAYTDAGKLVEKTYTWRQWFEKAFANNTVSARVPGQYDPVDYTRQESFFGEFKGGDNPSLDSSAGGDVTFTDRARGADFELVFQPRTNLQFLFNYSYTQRVAQGAFNMVDYIDLNDGQMYAGTEYYRIVQVFGRAAFGITSKDTNNDGVPDAFFDQHGKQLSETNPLRPSEALSGIDGVSLFFNPTHQATFWSRYDFIDGPLKNLGFGLGMNYTSGSQTAVSIGGTRIGQNLYPTPDTASNWTLNGGVYYQFKALKTRWKLKLNVNNILDDKLDVTTASYADALNKRTVNKRSEVFRTPRSFRLTATTQF